MSDSPPPYRVLARKYRPRSFAELIGQDAMVQTLGNAIARGRLAHAFLLTGVRGVGKTSTARLIAKALNCVGPDGDGGPTISPCGVCEPCASIAEGRNIDVVEMDAASHTGVDDMRAVIDASTHAAFGARFKIYIVDEVHMLSKSAFNALLKTLEEPPPHVKFLLATTEVQKVPVTVLSRCQRFDLRRIPADRLVGHFAHVCAAEEVSAEPEALALIARAAEGSARDGLSILDQAIAHGAGGVTERQVRDMLGLSDRGAVRALFARLLAGDAAGVLAAVAEQHALGVDPAALLRGLLEVCHGVTRAKVGGSDPAQSEEERVAYAEWASGLGFAALHRLWQLLLKGHGEVAAAALPREAAEMALLRVVHAATLPDPGELARRLAEGSVAAPAAPLAIAAPVPPRYPADFAGLVKALQGMHAHLSQKLHDCVGLVRYAPPELAVKRLRPLDADFDRQVKAALKAVVDAPWQISVVDEGEAAPSLLDQERGAEAAARARVLAMPVVRAAFESFPEAELTGYTLGETSAKG